MCHAAVTSRRQELSTLNLGDRSTCQRQFDKDENINTNDKNANSAWTGRGLVDRKKSLLASPSSNDGSSMESQSSSPEPEILLTQSRPPHTQPRAANSKPLKYSLPVTPYPALIQTPFPTRFTHTPMSRKKSTGLSFAGKGLRAPMRQCCGRSTLVSGEYN